MRLWRSSNAGSRLDSVVNVVLIGACLLVSANAGVTLWGRLVSGSRPASARPAAQQTPLPTEPISIKDRVTRGSDKASAVVIEYSDYQCPFCARFEHETWPILNQEYVQRGRVSWVYRHLPLEAIHAAAFRSAEAAECAAAQGRFEEFHGLLVRNRQQLDPASLTRYAQEARLNEAGFSECMKGSAREKVRDDMDSASKLGITGTPSFVIGVREPDGRIRLRERLVGAVPIAQFQASIDKVLSLPPKPSDHD